MLAVERLDGARQGLHEQAVQAGDADNAALDAAQPGQLALDAVELVQRAAGMADHQLAGGRQPEALGQPFEQLHPQLGLDLEDLAVDRRGRHIEPFRCLSYRPGAGDLLEITQDSGVHGRNSLGHFRSDRKRPDSDLPIGLLANLRQERFHVP